MVLATTVGVEHLVLGERPQYGQPYPEGIAVAAADVPDDASGGAHSFTFLADPGFLYRLELLQWTRGEETLRGVNGITVHRWATGRTPFETDAFDLNWFLQGIGSSGFSVYTLGSGAASGVDLMRMLRRFPMGPTGGGAPGVATQLLFLNTTSQVDTITNELAVVWTYWRKESLYLPGFLSAFYEAPAAPPVVR